MTCVFYKRVGRCKAPAAIECAGWQVGQGFCQEHIAVVRARLNNERPGDRWEFAIKNPKRERWDTAHGYYIEDYIKLYALMLDVDRCRELMQVLNREIATGARVRIEGSDERYSSHKRQSDKNYARLSRVLEYYEGLCWFPTTHRLYTGGLTSENYQTSIKLGYMPKDAGAGAEHGEYSHRLQWHMIMRVITEGFSSAFGGSWHYSPFELFTQLGQEWAMNRSIWGGVFDDGLGSRYDNPAVLNMDLCGSFQATGQNVAKQADAAKWRKDNAMLSGNAARRTEKRSRIVQRAQFLYRQIAPDRKQGDGLGGLALEQNIIGLLEKWKKLGRPPVGVYSEQIRDAQGRVIDSGNQTIHRIAHQIWEEQRLQTKPGLYDQDPDEANALLATGDAPMTEAMVRTRAESSRRALNLAKYAYTTSLGAYVKSDVWSMPSERTQGV